MCVSAVMVLAILRLNTFNKDQKSHELARFIFTKQPFLNEKTWKFSYFKSKQTTKVGGI